MNAKAIAVAAIALVLSGCAAAPAAPPVSASAVTPTPTPTPAAVELADACEQASAIIAALDDLDDIPDADQYASAADTMYALAESGDRDTKEVFTPVEAALKDLSTASPGMEYIEADQRLLDSLDTADKRCLAVGSDAFH
jgi:hypothetical protein